VYGDGLRGAAAEDAALHSWDHCASRLTKVLLSGVCGWTRWFVRSRSGSRLSFRFCLSMRMLWLDHSRASHVHACMHESHLPMLLFSRRTSMVTTSTVVRQRHSATSPHLSGRRMQLNLRYAAVLGNRDSCITWGPVTLLQYPTAQHALSHSSRPMWRAAQQPKQPQHQHQLENRSCRCACLVAPMNRLVAQAERLHIVA
jgi:hypothetical protein